MNGTIRRVCRDVKRWQDAKMALRWTAAGMMEATKGFRPLKAHRQLPILRSALDDLDGVFALVHPAGRDPGIERDEGRGHGGERQLRAERPRSKVDRLAPSRSIEVGTFL